MTTTHTADAIDARLLLALGATPRATALELAERTKLSRNTVQARLAKLESSDAVHSGGLPVDTVASVAGRMTAGGYFRSGHRQSVIS